jgi:hypothetical protein
MRHLPIVLALALVAAGCDAQFSPDYTGESLLTIVGSVEISDNHTKGRLVPALAFLNESQGEVSIQEVAVHGRFPSDFRLDVFEPPPDEAFVNLTHQKSGEPNVAFGYVTAVSSEHAESVRYGTHQTVTSYGCEETLCNQPCGGKGCLVQRSETCVDADPSLPCYTEETYCETYETPLEECRVEALGGDPALNQSPWETFAGFSQNYVVVYLRERATASSVTSSILGSMDGVPAGYGLYALRAPSEAEVAANQECTARAEVRAATAWNDEFDANLATLSFDICTTSAKGEITEFAAPFCGGPSDQEHLIDEAFEARSRLIEAAKLELGCPIFDLKLERVKDPASESVSVVIGREVQPIFVEN